MCLRMKTSSLGLVCDAGSLWVVARFGFLDDLFENILGNQFGSGLGGTTTVRMCRVLLVSISPR